MSNDRTVALITGAKGGIGSSLCSAFRSRGYFVVGTDRREDGAADCDAFIAADIATMCRDTDALARFRDDVLEAGEGRSLSVLVNNAAVQVVAPLRDLDYADWSLSLDTNLVAPAQLIRTFEKDLEAGQGSVLNIASVHAKATKPGFACYATTKSAMVGLTRALAVELGGRVRVNALCPAAVNTEMLKDGFADNPQGLAALASFHPVGRIAEPEEIGAVAVFLASPEATFLTGSVIDFDGAVLSRLYDPGT